MKIRLLRDARIRHKIGDIVDVPDDEAFFLLSVGSAVEMTAEPAQAKVEEAVVVPKAETRKKTKK